MVRENKQSKEYIANIRQRYQQYQQQPQQEQFSWEREYFQRSQKRYKKIDYEEETDSELEEEESQYVPDDEFIEQEKQKEQKQLQVKRKNKIFDYLDKDVKGNKQ